MRDLILKTNPSQPPLIRGGEDVRITDIKFIPYNKKLVSRARELRLEQTPAEKIFWKALVNSIDKVFDDLINQIRSRHSEFPPDKGD
ncbi:MAG: hypothetical protein WC027_02090 [Candidatus Paceibacterota bacterium]